MDKLTEMVEDYKETNDQNLIIKIQRIVYPIIKKLIYKWHFNNFPLIIQEHLYAEAKTTILTEALQKFDASKGSKFTSFYGTRLNYILRSEYMKYFQKAKPITKRYGRLHELSIDLKYEEGKTLGDLLKQESDIRTEIQNNFLNSAIKQLKPKERKVIQLLYFNPVPQNKVREITNLTNKEIKREESKVLNKLKTLI